MMVEKPVHLSDAQINADIIRPTQHISLPFKIGVALLLAVMGFGLTVYLYMVLSGMGVAGINRPVQWGIFIATFVFWIGLSHSGTLISAILRLSQAEWRRPITRGAEVMTVFTVAMGALYPLIHLGRVWKFYYILPIPDGRGLWPNFRSALVWDFMAITTYLTGSILYLYLPMVPDMAVMRDKSTGWKKRIYTLLSLGWHGSDKEWHHLHRALGIFMIVILPVAVSVHSIVSWDFAMSLVPLWHSTIFAPYFVAGAIYSGLALVVTLMWLLRWGLHLGDYLRPSQFDNLGKMLFMMSIIWFYFWFSDALTTWYGRLPTEFEALRQTILGPFWWIFATMILFNFLVPFFTLGFRRFRVSAVSFVVSLLINVGMFCERFLIVVPPLSHSHLPFVWRDYAPTWVEISIVGATFAGFTLLYLLFTKFFPIVAIWEIKEGQLLRSDREVAGVKLPTITRME